MSDDALLQEKARELIRAGKLPGRRPERIWGGAGFGGRPCTLCGARIKRDEMALEIEVNGADGAGTTYAHLHVRCFSVLESELQGRPASPDAADRSGRQAA
jgi:hypothetical protein